MARVNRYLYLNVLQGNYGYGHGWEDLCQSEDRREMREDLRAYRENAPEYQYRIIRRRELSLNAPC